MKILLFSAPAFLTFTIFSVPLLAQGTNATSVPAAAASASADGIKIINGPNDLAPTTKAFAHPGMYYSAADLAFVRQKLADHAEPWTGAWAKIKPTGRDDAWKPHAVAAWDCDAKEVNMYMDGDPVVAHHEALAWALTGNQANADEAIKILNAWASTLQSITSHTMPQEKLACGASFAHLCNAAELIAYGGPDGKSSGWADADIQKFKQMLQIPYATMKSYQSGYNGNWDMLMMDSMISIAVFLDDRAMFDETLQHYVVGVKPNGGITNYVYESGQCQESYRDEGHVQWGLTGAIGVCQVAWNQGVDIYGAYDNRLLKGLEYCAKFNLGNDVPYEGKGAISQGGRGQFAYMWEAPYRHYVVDKGLEMPFTKQVVESTNIKAGFNRTPGSYRPEGDNTVGMGWGTLLMYRGDAASHAGSK